MRINEAAQKTHRLAIDLFLVMIISYSLVAGITNNNYEIVPDEYAQTIITEEGKEITIFVGYEQQTNYDLITKKEWDHKRQEIKDFQRPINIFGIIIFVLYSFTQYKNWKKKFRPRSESFS